MNFFIRWLRVLQVYLSRFTQPRPEELVLSLILNTASLGLQKGQYVELAPIKGTCGSFKLSGNSLPRFEYTVFDKTKGMMEFITVIAEISKPDRIEFHSVINAKYTTDAARHGERVVTKDKYKEPFLILVQHLFKYFPFPMHGGVVKNEEIQVQNQSPEAAPVYRQTH